MPADLQEAGFRLVQRPGFTGNWLDRARSRALSRRSDSRPGDTVIRSVGAEVRQYDRLGENQSTVVPEAPHQVYDSPEGGSSATDSDYLAKRRISDAILAKASARSAGDGADTNRPVG